jgi:protein-S-isoprenylcysteine O-methyltransferase Ste14
MKGRLLGGIFRQRGLLANVPLFFALFWTRGEVNAPLLCWGLGVGLLLLGVAVRVWAQSHIRHRLVVPMQLTWTGPYRLVRNPLYIGNTLIIVGATVFSRLLWLAPLALIWCAIVYSLVVRYEEGFLAELYGEPYRQFLARVPRWLPRLSGFQKPDFSNQYLGRAVRAELHCFLVLLPFLIKGTLLNPTLHPFWNRLMAQL